MATPEQKLEKLKLLLEAANTDYATPDDIAKLSTDFLEVIKHLQATLEAKMAENKGIADKGDTQTLATLRAIEARCVGMCDDYAQSTAKDIQKASDRLRAEIQTVSDRIPQATDLRPLSDRLDAIHALIPTLPDPQTGEDYRNALEALTGDDRLDKSAIRGLDELLAEIKKSGTTGIQYAGVRLLRYLADVAVDSVTNGQVLTWNTATSKWIPATPGAASLTLYTETPSGLINGVNVTYTTLNSITNVFSFAINGQHIHPSQYSKSGSTITIVGGALDASLSGTPFTIIYS